MDKKEEILKELSKKAISLMADWPSSRHQQKKFVLEYISSGFINASEAARKAGYSEKSISSKANQLLSGVNKYKHIKPVVDEVRKIFDEKSAEISIAEATEVLQFMTSVLRDEEKETVLVNIGDFKQEPMEVPVSMKDRLKAGELLGKSYGLWTDKQEISIEPTIISGADKLED